MGNSLSSIKCNLCNSSRKKNDDGEIPSAPPQTIFLPHRPIHVFRELSLGSFRLNIRAGGILYPTPRLVRNKRPLSLLPYTRCYLFGTK